METLSKNKIKWIRSLRKKKMRDTEGVFVVEGVKMVEEIVANWPDLIHLICVTNPTLFTQHNCVLTDDKTMKEISNLSTPGEVLAVVSKPSPEAKNQQHLLLIDGVQDPGNLGTIIRTADWFGIDRLICSKDTVDAFNAKVIQSSMGSLFRVAVEYVNLEAFIQTTPLPVYGALLGGENVYTIQIPNAWALVVGNEGNGISKAVQECVQIPVLIPGKGNAESLNVAVATGILLNEFTK